MSLKVVDMQIGPGSYVAYAGINKIVHELFGVNMTLYNITDWAGVWQYLHCFWFCNTWVSAMD